MDQVSEFLGQRPLSNAGGWTMLGLLDELVYRRDRPHGERAQQLRYLTVVCVEPELVEGIGLVSAASSQTEPDSVLPNLVPSALVTSGVVKA